MLTVKPMSLADANRFVAEHHRHHKPVRGHIRRLLSLVLKSVDFGAKKPLSCLSDASHGKTPTPPFKRRSERKKQRFSHPN